MKIHDEQHSPRPDASSLGPVDRSRNHAAQLVSVQRDMILSRIRFLLKNNSRRITDTEEILSTAMRRVDTVILRGELRAKSDREIYGFIHSVIERTILEKARSSSRSTRRELAAYNLKDQVKAESDESQSHSFQQIAQIGQLVSNPVDREIVLLKGRDYSFKQIAQIIGMDQAAVRMRWLRIRAHVRGKIQEDELL